MTSEWTLALDGDATASRRNAGDCHNGVIDLELFPDLQGIDKTSALKDSFSCDIEPQDDELLNYFRKTDRNERSGQTLLQHPGESQQSLLQTPEVNSSVASTVTLPNPSSKSMVKVVTLRQGIIEGGKILVVQEAPNGTVGIDKPSVNGPNSPGSSIEDGQHSEASRCMSKNAIAARENRQRKKQHIDSLEKSVEALTTENSTLRSNLTRMTETVESLQQEVKYLRSVLANQSTLAKLLENIPMVPGLTLSKSEAIGRASNSYKSSSRKRPAPVDESEALGSDGECDCHPQKNVCMCSKENRYCKQTRTQDGNLQADHSYATEGITTGGTAASRLSTRSQKMRTRSQVPDNVETTGGVCLHVSGSSVSLEFCSSCSRQAVSGRRSNQNKK